ncbi:MAG: class II aldolase/adducin family protein [Candidatus Omnitrophica bacterium]|nr:class II aldolase/adducin family protein [Candidatus Omnitrophota bacterium]
MNTIEKLIHYGKKLHEKDLDIGSGGNISALEGSFLIIKKQGINMESCGPEGYIKVPFDNIQKTDQSLLSSETPFHIACYRSRKDVLSVFHVHSPNIVAVSLLVDKIEKGICYEFEYINCSDATVIDYYAPGSEVLAGKISDEIKKGINSVILKKHGAVCVGENIEQAYLRAFALERACSLLLSITT